MVEASEVKVLFVDDESNILRSLERLFMDEEFTVLTANSGEKGLKLLREEQAVGLIVSDQRMPGMDGVEFLSLARGLAPEALRIVLTGYADLNATMDAINKGGAYRYITKPWNDADLLQTIRDAVRQYSLILENRRLNAVIQQQNLELQEWNANLKNRVLENTAKIRQQNEELRRQSEELQLLNAEMSSNWQNTLLAFSSMVGLRDPLARYHSRKVSLLAEDVARALGLAGTEVESVRIAGLLHDIGEIGIDPPILDRNYEAIISRNHAGLAEMERHEFRLHPVRGQTAVDVVEGLRPSGVLIRHHHEHFDGTGFPDGLRGDAIPLGARIIAMADFIDIVMTRHRAARTCKDALGMAERRLGAELDPSLFPLFAELAPERYADVVDLTRMAEVELPPKELRPEMVLAREVTSGTGLLLLNKGATLDEVRIASLKRYYQLDPPHHGVYVLVPL